MQHPLTNTWRKKAPKSGQTTTLSSFRISPQQATILVIPCLVAVPRCSFQSLSSKHLGAYFNQSKLPQSNSKDVTVLSLDSGSGFSYSSRSLSFRMSTIWPTAWSWLRRFSNSKISSATDAPICVFGHDSLDLGANGVSRGEECNAFARNS